MSGAAQALRESTGTSAHSADGCSAIDVASGVRPARPARLPRAVGARTRQRAEAALAEARRLLEAGEPGRAVDDLERARKGFLAEADLGGMQEVRRAAEEGYAASEPADEPAYERLLYASGQNVRFLSRRRAAAAGLPWEDPHPELDAPGRPEIRAERGVTKRDVPWILVFGGLGVAVVASLIALWIYAVVVAVDEHDRTIANDSARPVLVSLCDRPCDDGVGARLLRPGESLTYRTSYDAFLVTSPDGERIGCVDTTDDGAAVSAADAEEC
jgi:hypothetical protein